MHRVVDSKHFVAVGAFSRSRLHPLLNAFPAEYVSAGLEGRVFEVQSADGTDSEGLMAKISEPYSLIALPDPLEEQLTRSISYFSL